MPRARSRPSRRAPTVLPPSRPLTRHTSTLPWSARSASRAGDCWVAGALGEPESPGEHGQKGKACPGLEGDGEGLAEHGADTGAYALVLCAAGQRVFGESRAGKGADEHAEDGADGRQEE